jgi:hypothetical protein
MLKDRWGLPTTGESAEAVAHLDAAIESYCGARRDSGGHLKRAFAAAPDFLMGHILHGYFMMLFGKRELLPRAAQSAAMAEAALVTGGGTTRERLHLHALQQWTLGRMRETAAALEAILADHPRDLLAARLAQHLYFYMGMSEAMRDSAARILPAWDQKTPGYGFVLGCHAFGLEETGDYAAAERAGRIAVALNRGDVWAAHAVAHVCEMENRVTDGIAWLDAFEREWGEVNNFIFHIRWHRCLYLLELERHDEVLERYDSEVRPESTDEQLDISNAVALLWRLEQLGVDVGDRWAELAAQSRRHTDDHLLAFPDIHYAMALAAVADDDGLESWWRSARGYAATAPEHEACVMAEIGLALADAAVAHRRRDWSRVIATLLPARHAIARVGGSHAQRDVFHRMLIDAGLNAGRPDVAHSLLTERARFRSRDLWAERHIALASAGDPMPAALSA